MRHVRMLGACLVVTVLALGSVMAAGASAKLPEWGRCETSATHEGKYGDAGCIVPVKKVYGHYTGGYEWVPGGIRFESGHIAPTTFETTNGKKIYCPTGELEDDQIAGGSVMRQILVSLYECESEGKECRSQFEPYGRITNEFNWGDEEAIEGELVYLSGRNTTSPTVGMTLTTEVAGQPLFVVVCEGELGSVKIGGEGGKKSEKAKGNTIIGTFSPLNEMTTEYTQTFNQTAGVQEWVKAEKGKEKALQMLESNEQAKWFQTGLASTFTYIVEPEIGAIELKATP